MFKRIISILLTVLMCMSMVTFTAMADGASISVTYLNADSTKIMIDLSEEVAVAELTDAIKLKAGNTEVTDFRVDKKSDTPNPKTGAAMTKSGDSSYVIIPEEGIEFDTIYQLTIPSSILKADADDTRYFVVEKLWGEDFQSEAYGTTAGTFPWKDVKGNGTLSIETENNNKFLKIVTQSAQTSYSAVIPDNASGLNFGDTGIPASEFWAGTWNKGTVTNPSEALLMTDYNIEMKVRAGYHTTNTTSPFGRLYLCMQKHSNSYPDSGYYCPFLEAGAYRYDASSNGAQKVLYVQATSKNADGYKQSCGKTGYNQAMYVEGVTAQSQPFSSEDFKSFSMSAKGKNIRLFADEAFASYYHTIEIDAYGVPDLVSYGNGYICVDDIIATKMTELSDLEVTYWNADSSKIMLDLNAEVDADALKKAITLTKDGVEITDLKVNKKPETPPATGSMTADADYSYVIEPSEGIILSTSAKETVYNLTINQGLLSSDKTKMLHEEESINFAVDKLWIEDFENEAYNTSSASTFPWTDHYDTPATFTIETENDNKVLKAVSTSNNTTIRPNKNSAAAFADTGVAANIYWADGSDARTQEEYNVELKVKFENETYRSFRIFMMDTLTTASYDYAGGVAGGAYYKLDDTAKNMYAQVGLKGSNNSSTRQGAGAEVAQIKALNPVPISPITPFASDDYNTLSMSVKDENVKVFAGGDAFISYDYTTPVANYGAIGLVTHISNGGTFYIDDIKVTKAREIATPDFGTSLTVVEGATEGTKTVSWTYDAKGNSIPCKVILASYGASNSLKNVIPWDGTDLSGKGAVTFENFDLKGGTELKLFVWEDLATLYPYCATIEWPKAD